MSDALDPRRTCLLFFDTLNGYLKDRETGLKPEFTASVANMRRLLDAARRAKMMVAYAIGSHRPDMGMYKPTWTDTDNRLRPVEELRWWKPPVLAGEWSGGIVDEIAPTPDDYILPKYRWSAFAGTYLDLALRARDVDTIVVVGGSTDIGIAATAFSAHDLDYNVVIACDACTCNEQDNHDQFMERIFPRMARVRTTDDVLAMLRAT